MKFRFSASDVVSGSDEAPGVMDKYQRHAADGTPPRPTVFTKSDAGTLSSRSTLPHRSPAGKAERGRERRGLTPLATAALVSVVLLSRALAGSGDLDPSFGSGGKVVTDFPAPASDVATDVAVQSDAKLVVLGESTADTGRLETWVVRYTAAGALDPTFGNEGMVKLDFASDPEGGELVIQPDGKIVIAGSSSVVRLTADGMFDPTFDGDGKAVFASGRADAVVLDATGRIIVAGGSTVARYTSSGGLDTSFDSDGTATTAGLGIADLHGVAIDSAGQIVVVGSIYPLTAPADMALARFNSNGALDTSFGIGGIARVDFGGADLGQAIAIQSDDKIVVGGPHGSEFAIARLDASGALDPSFDADGRASFDLGGSVQALAIQADGKIVAAGGGSNKFMLLRLNSTGALDVTFDADGKQMTEFSGPSAVQTGALALQVDGKIVVAGSAAGDFGIVRYTSGGALDTTFDTDGKVITAFLGPTVNAGEDIAMQPDGKLVVVGTIATERDTAIARYTTAGALDSTFGTEGRVVLNADTTEFARAVAVQSDGKILVAGMSFGTTVDLFLFRLLADGTLDPTFGTGGLVKTNFSTSFLQVNAIAIQPDTKILVAGAEFSGGADFLVLRYNADGTLDTSFGSGGKVRSDLFGSSADVATSIALQDDGKIVLAGSTAKTGSTGFPTSVALARYDSAGALDASFDGDGKVRTLVGSFSRAQALAVRPDKRIVVAGLTSGTGGSDFLVLRYEQAGSLDPSFDGDGIVTTDIAAGDQAKDLVIQADGAVVVAGTSVESSGASDISIARYRNDGSLDTSFSADGKTTTDVDQYDVAGGVVATASAIIVAGRTGGDTRPTADDFLLIQYQSESSSVFRDRNAFIAAAGPLTTVNFDTTACGVAILPASGGSLAGSFYANVGVTFDAGVIFDLSPFPNANPPSPPNVITNAQINTPTPALVDGTFASPVAAVGITNTGAEAILRVFDASDNLIDSIKTDTNVTTQDFVGILSSTPIHRFEFDFVSGVGFEGDDLLFSQIMTADCTPPVITCPADITVNATSPNGAVVNFNVIATDNVAVGSVVVNPPSGSTFPIGTTTVNATATDTSGNSASCSFTVKVKSAAEQLQDLMNLVGTLNHQGLKTSLTSILQAALGKVQSGELTPACNMLDAFINEVKAQRGKKLTAAEADQLIADAERIKDVLSCP